MTDNITWHENEIKRSDREKQNGHQAVCLWLTGLSGSGKSTIANSLQNFLFANKVNCYILDGDNIRHGLNSDLGFSDKDRTENIRRIGEVARLFVDAGLIVITAFISPFIKDRDDIRALLPEGKFIEVFVDCDLKTCEQRDPKGLYKKVREGKIKEFTGVSSEYEPPENPELIIDNSGNITIDQNTKKIVDYLKVKNIINL